MNWMTMDSHPASGTRYQETPDGRTARVTVEGVEVIRPRRNTDLVFKGYRNLVNRAIEELTGE